MTITQHAHIYSFHTLIFIFGKNIFLKFLSKLPLFLTNSHVQLDNLVDTQESVSTSHHRIALQYDEDTVSLVVDPTLSTSDILSISYNSNSSAGNASAFEYECYDVEDDTP